MTGGKSIKSKIIFQFIERFFNNSCYFCIASRLQGRKSLDSGLSKDVRCGKHLSDRKIPVCMEE